ncbi:hypothetical protein JTB14_030496 [Gonioctena quinquepunctata]|nr:hypothetical protein JTB14_030496 [Gonioctena quinquepunctata]
MDERGTKDVSISTTNTFLCPKRGYLDIKDQRMKPGDIDDSHFEEMFLQDRILRVLTCHSDPMGITMLYENENYLYDPSAISYFEEELESTYIIAPRKHTAEDRVAVLYFPREREAEAVVLEDNVFRRFRNWLMRIFGCGSVRKN